MAPDINPNSPTPLARRDMSLLRGMNGQDLKVLFKAGMDWLRTNHQYVNSLNVFPVPDGDTGTNMLLTMQAGYQEIEDSNESNVGKVAHAISKGALLGARGNSGVILSQIWRGFARGLDNYDTMNAEQFSEALNEAKNTAYKGVVRPVEGTILTVIKDMAAFAQNNTSNDNDLLAYLDLIVGAAEVSVNNTPELLPVLKQAGVVDSGGKGLYYIFEGMLRYAQGKELDKLEGEVLPLAELNLEDTMHDIEEGQDYEVVIDFEPNGELNLEQYYGHLATIGTSIQIGEGDGMYRMHIHVPTDKRYEAIEYTNTLGTVLKVNMENLIAQMETRLKEKQEEPIVFAPVNPGEMAVIAVAPGEGFARIFASLGVAAVVYGGQTMNPSTEEILEAFENLPTDKIIILPNNKNVTMAAQSAVNMSKKKVAVIPSKNAPQGLSAILRFIPTADFDSTVEEMNEAIWEVDTGEVTIAIRSIEINGVTVKEGEVIGILNGQLVASSSSLHDTCIELIRKADTSNKERITYYYGNNISKAEVEVIVEDVKKEFPKHEYEIHHGGQPHYQFIIAIE